ncbi:MAG: hypothetical protein IJV82_01415 [Oscillospiraceae bacterium]|nr:hypothetical protein [Oscillospiraceae bacterium]
MNNENTFSYTYSAPEQQEVLNIRKKYLPQSETKLEELKRLDGLVQTSGVMEALSIGIMGCLVFGLGLCLAMEVIGSIRWLGILLGAIGAVGMGFAYPINRKFYEKNKQKYAPRILELAAELTGEI